MNRNYEEGTNQSQDVMKYVTDNNDFKDVSALKMRLDSDPLLSRIEYYLKGEQQVMMQNSAGEPAISTIKVSKPKANPNGIHNLMAWISMTVNSQTVQGNLENHEALGNYISFYRMDLAEFIMNNLENWEIVEEDFEGIVDLIVNNVKLFLSRLVFNKERESYSNTIQHRESGSSTQSTTNKTGGFKFRIPGLSK